jgi:hypothetical protein
MTSSPPGSGQIRIEDRNNFRHPARTQKTFFNARCWLDSRQNSKPFESLADHTRFG